MESESIIVETNALFTRLADCLEYLLCGKGNGPFSNHSKLSRWRRIQPLSCTQLQTKTDCLTKVSTATLISSQPQFLTVEFNQRQEVGQETAKKSFGLRVKLPAYPPHAVEASHSSFLRNASREAVNTKF